MISGTSFNLHSAEDSLRPSFITCPRSWSSHCPPKSPRMQALNWYAVVISSWSTLQSVTCPSLPSQTFLHLNILKWFLMSCLCPLDIRPVSPLGPESQSVPLCWMNEPYVSYLQQNRTCKASRLVEVRVACKSQWILQRLIGEELDIFCCLVLLDCLWEITNQKNRGLIYFRGKKNQNRKWYI